MERDATDRPKQRQRLPTANSISDNPNGATAGSKLPRQAATQKLPVSTSTQFRLYRLCFDNHLAIGVSISTHP